jgi:putative endonuclease
MTNKKHGVLYIGVTNDIYSRISQHRTGKGSKFCKKYGIDKLVYCEETDDIAAAIMREKQMKKWRREWKIRLIEKDNPEWEDLNLA